LLLYYENIADKSSRASAMLVAAGDAMRADEPVATRLSVVLAGAPTGRVLEQPFKAKLSADGSSIRVTARPPPCGRRDKGTRRGDAVPPGRGRARRGRTVIAAPKEAPAAVLDRKGKGRVAL